MRARFFNEVRSCRRRPQIPVEDTPVGRFLTKASELGLLHRRAIATRIRFALANKGLRIADGFAAMDRSREGTLSPAELSKGMEWLGLKLCPRCVTTMQFLLHCRESGYDILDSISLRVHSN